MKIVIITDQHQGIKNDSSYMLDHQEEFYKNVFFPYLKNNHIDTIWNLGDLFDRRKYINFQTLYRSRKMFLDVIADNNFKMYIIPGNHDIALKNTNHINALETLLQEYETIRIISEPETIEFDGLNVMFIPWISPENSQRCFDHIRDNSENAPVVCGHFEIVGFEMYRGSTNIHGITSEIFKDYEQVFSGHFHLKSTNGNISYLGAPFQFTWADYNEEKGFHVYDTETKELEFIPNPYKLYEKIYYDDSLEDYNVHEIEQYENKIVHLVVNNKTKPAVYDNFVDRLYKVNMVDFKILENLITHDDMSEEIDDIRSQSTKELIDNYIDDITTELCKDRLKSVLNGLYLEASQQ